MKGVVVGIAALRVGRDLVGPAVTAAVRVDRHHGAPSAAAVASTMVERPRNEPISTICPPAPTRRAACHNLRAWSSVIHPSTPATAASTGANSCSVPATLMAAGTVAHDPVGSPPRPSSLPAMSKPRRTVGVPVLLGLVAYALAFAQRPGLATADTKINLHVDPGRFLGDIASMWTSTGQLGGVQTGQQAGYLFPMGPFFALGHLIGLPDWVVQRLWLGSLLALAAWGAVRLLDALLAEPRGVAHLVTGLVILLNPFVVTYANRTTVTLLAYAALPWLLLAVHRGLREPGGWRWPAAVALLVTAAGGGVNGAVVAWMLLGPALLLVYEVAVTEVTVADARAFLVRAIPLAVLLSLWWVIPAYVQSAYGVNFLQFTEQPGTVWGTTSSTEALRLMSFWLSYVGIGFQGRAIPYFDDALTLLFSAPVVVATLLLPAAALGGFAGDPPVALRPVLPGPGPRRGAGDDGRLPRRHAPAPRAVLHLQPRGGGAVPARLLQGRAAARRRPRRPGRGGGRRAVGAARGAVGARLARRVGRLRAGGGGRRGARGRGLAAGHRPRPGRPGVLPPDPGGVAAGGVRSRSRASRQLPRDRPARRPVQLLHVGRDGGPDPARRCPRGRSPSARRCPTPTCAPPTSLWTIDGLVHQQRLVPGQLGPLLSLIGVRSVVSGADDDLARSDAPAPGRRGGRAADPAGLPAAGAHLRPDRALCLGHPAGRHREPARGAPL